jgi:hypothetical protein
MPFSRLNSKEIDSAAVVIEVAFNPTIKVTQHEVNIDIHFFQRGQLKGLWRWYAQCIGDWRVI